jgi:hypothetical protein
LVVLDERDAALDRQVNGIAGAGFHTEHWIGRLHGHPTWTERAIV